MSYLGWPRLHFSGRFQADTSTVNNDVRHYKSDVFEPQFQKMMVGQGAGNNQRTNGYWNPEGTGAWRMLGCRITGAAQQGKLITDERDDATIGLLIAGSNDRVAGKLVDLDPQQQAVSQIWGLRIALDDLQGNRLLDSEYMVSTFTDLWKRQQIPQNFDQTLAAAFQSKLGDVEWGNVTGYPILQALKVASEDGLLSIRFNVFGFDRSPEADDYTTGVVIGTIGPTTKAEPKHFVLGRQMVTQLVCGNPTAPANEVYGFQCLDHPQQKTMSVDLGHSLPILGASGDLKDIGALYMAVDRCGELVQGQCVAETKVALLGKVNYLDQGWYTQSAGIVDFNYSDDDWLTSNLKNHPLVLLKNMGSNKYQVLVVESCDGLYARVDNYVYRLNPGEEVNLDFYATRFGYPVALDLLISANNAMLGGAGTGATLNMKKWPVPAVGKPASAMHYPDSLSIDASGHAQLTLKADAAGPGTPRGYLDGQVYGVGYSLQIAPTDYVYDLWNFISILIWDAWEDPDEPTWYRDIQPIMEQYGNLYPIMSKHLVELGDYDSVVKYLKPLKLSFSLPVSDPNSMPVSRDLSANKRMGILKWLENLDSNGLPLKGQPQDRPICPAPTAITKTHKIDADTVPDPGGKLDYLMQILARNHSKNQGEESC
ncbi:MAG: hypothetical protein V3U88_04190 [Methylococcales bacterium]